VALVESVVVAIRPVDLSVEPMPNAAMAMEQPLAVPDELVLNAVSAVARAELRLDLLAQRCLDAA
jgi:hypothetical protein